LIQKIFLAVLFPDTRWVAGQKGEKKFFPFCPLPDRSLGAGGGRGARGVAVVISAVFVGQTIMEVV
jgi:hypothetical protein